MKIILIGYGKMAKAVEVEAIKRNHTISEIIFHGDLNKLKKESGEVVVEFTNPDSAFENIRECLNLGLPVISGTTGWLDKKSEIDAHCLKMDGTFFYASNFSIGVNLFLKINQAVAGIMERKGYQISIEEIHHIHKKDAPSGTAISIANNILQNTTEYKEWALNQNKPYTIPIEAIREGEVPGTHKVSYSSDVDKIALTHEAYGREGFAKGVISAVEWISGKKGPMGMDDLLNI
jgi:4-hydroxy-tetrahydrodipicolinate reductase